MTLEKIKGNYMHLEISRFNYEQLESLSLQSQIPNFFDHSERNGFVVLYLNLKDFFALAEFKKNRIQLIIA